LISQQPHKQGILSNSHVGTYMTALLCFPWKPYTMEVFALAICMPHGRCVYVDFKHFTKFTLIWNFRYCSKIISIIYFPQVQQ
jgi:hypothetical protein